MRAGRRYIAAPQFGALERFLCDGDEGPQYSVNIKAYVDPGMSIQLPLAGSVFLVDGNSAPLQHWARLPERGTSGWSGGQLVPPGAAAT